MRTQTLVKNAIIQIDAAPFKQYYHQHYGVEVGLKKKTTAGQQAAEKAAEEVEEAVKTHSNHVQRKLKARTQGRKLDQVRNSSAQMN